MLSRGVHSVKFSTFDLMRVWAAVTGVALAAVYFALVYLGYTPSESLPMLIAGIGGFELVLVGQDIWFKREARRG